MIYFSFGSIFEIFCGERINGQEGDMVFYTSARYGLKVVSAFGVTNDFWESALGCPTSIPIHDDGNVLESIHIFSIIKQTVRLCFRISLIKFTVEIEILLQYSPVDVSARDHTNNFFVLYHRYTMNPCRYHETPDFENGSAWVCGDKSFGHDLLYGLVHSVTEGFSKAFM